MYRAIPKPRHWQFCALVSAALISPATLPAADRTVNHWYQSSVSSDANGPLDLLAELNYDDALSNAPIAVVMHGYGQNINDIRANALHLRNDGFFAISVAMRQRNGSDGVFDSGGLEIYDIYDAVESVIAAYPARVNPGIVCITGYSGGGGNVMSALTKFPDYFNAGAGYFGMSDYGYDETTGWWFNTSNPGGDRNMLTDKIGDRASGDPYVLDKYMARASNLAAKNNPYSEIHLFTNLNETRVPIIHIRSYRDNAVAAAGFAGEFDNITVHEGQSGTYEDFNGNGINELNEQQYWPHRNPYPQEQESAEAWFIDRLKNGQIHKPVLNPDDELFVAGFVKTSKFECWVGDGQDGTADLIYTLSPTSKQFEFSIASNDKGIGGWISVDTSDMAGETVGVLLNGVETGSFTGGSTYLHSGLADGDVLELSASPPPLIVPLTTLSQDSNDWIVTFDSETGVDYQLRYAPSLGTDPATWTPAGDPVPGTGSPLSLRANKTEIQAGASCYFAVELVIAP